MIKVQFDSVAARQAIRRAVSELKDGTEMFADIGEYMLSITDQRFAKRISPDGSPWAPKRQATLDRYKARGYSGQSLRLPLHFGGLLRRSISQYVSRANVRIGSSKNYSALMQFGASKGAFGADSHGRPIPWGRIPARPWLGISLDDEAAIVGIAEDHIEKILDPKP